MDIIVLVVILAGAVVGGVAVWVLFKGWEQVAHRRETRFIFAVAGAALGAMLLLAILGSALQTFQQPTPTPDAGATRAQIAYVAGLTRDASSPTPSPTAAPPTPIPLPGAYLSLTGHAGRVNVVAWTADGKYLASGGEDETVRIWDEREQVAQFDAGDAVETLAWSPNGLHLAFNGERNKAIIWSNPTGGGASEIIESGNWDAQVESAAWSPDGARLVTMNALDGVIRIWDTATNAARGQLEDDPQHAKVVWGDEALAAFGALDGRVSIWRMDEPAVTPLSGHEIEVVSAAWSPDGARCVTADRRGNVKVWDTAVWRALISMENQGDVWSVAWSPDGNHLAGGGDGRIYIWDAATGGALTPLETDAGPTYAVAWARDGRLAAGTDKRGVQVWYAP